MGGCPPAGRAGCFTRKEYRDIVVESLKYCQKEKGLFAAWLVYYEQPCSFDWVHKIKLFERWFLLNVCLSKKHVMNHLPEPA
jgi:hypothetical protein